MVPRWNKIPKTLGIPELTVYSNPWGNFLNLLFLLHRASNQSEN